MKIIGNLCMMYLLLLSLKIVHTTIGKNQVSISQVSVNIHNGVFKMENQNIYCYLILYTAPGQMSLNIKY